MKRSRTRVVVGAIAIFVGLVLVTLLFLDGGSASSTRPRALEATPTAESQDVKAARLASEAESVRAPLGDVDRVDEKRPAVGRVQVLSFRTRRPVVDVEFNATPDESSAGRSSTMRSSAEGILTLPPGTWRFTSADYSCMPATIEVDIDRPATLWVQELGSLRFSIVDLSGRPIVGATGSWFMDDDLWPLDEVRPAFATGVSDGDGMLVFERCPTAFGTAVFVAAGYQATSRRISGGLSETLNVFLLPDAGRTTCIRVLAAESNASLHDAEALACYGTMPLRADPQGEICIPSWVIDREWLMVSAPGRIPARVELRHVIDSTILLYRASNIVVRVTNATGVEEAAELFVDPVQEAVRSAHSWPAVRGRRHVAAGASIEFTLPRDVPYRLAAISAHGECAELEFVALYDRHEIQLQAGPSRGLSLSVRTADGAPLRDPRAVITVTERGPLTLRPTTNGKIVVPAVERVSRIRVLCDGYVAQDIVPNSKVDKRQRTGSIDIALERGIDPTIVVRSSAGDPLAGIQLQLWLEASGFKQYPDLNGGWPTSHPAWVLRKNGAIYGTTDGDGTFATQCVSPGEYGIYLTLPFLFGDCASRSFETRIFSALASKHEIVIPAPKPVTIEAFESTTRAPLSSLLISTESNELQESVVGNFWQGWVNQSDAYVDVVGVGVGSARVSLDPEKPSEHKSVALSSDDAASLRVRGVADALPSRRVSATVLRNNGAGYHFVSSFELNLDEAGTAHVYLPFEGDLAIALDSSSLRTKDLQITPELVPWKPGGELEFSVVSRR